MEKNKRRKKSPIKLKLPRMLPPVDYDESMQQELRNNPPFMPQSAPVLIRDGIPHQSLLPQTPLPLSALSAPSPSNYDLTDRDSVRQLLSNRG